MGKKVKEDNHFLPQTREVLDLFLFVCSFCLFVCSLCFRNKCKICFAKVIENCQLFINNALSNFKGEQGISLVYFNDSVKSKDSTCTSMEHLGEVWERTLNSYRRLQTSTIWETPCTWGNGDTDVQITNFTLSRWKNWKIYKTVVQPAILHGHRDITCGYHSGKSRWRCVDGNVDTQGKEYHVRSSENQWTTQKVLIGVVLTSEEERPKLWCRRYTLAMEPLRKRQRGRPKLIWFNCVSSDTKAIWATEDDAKVTLRSTKFVSGAATWQPIGSN